MRELGRRGAVLGVSGGVDSGVCAALAVRAFGPKHVLLLRMPERDIGQGASDLGLELAESLGAPQREESISAALEGLGCYRRRDEAIREVFPEYEAHWKHKVVRSAPGGVVVFALVIEKPDGSREEKRIPATTYRKLIAATNMKQRVRKLIEYTWADALGYAVIGTPNRLEYDQGFFVKGGDGLADIKPIAKLYKTQVYALARHLGLPAAIAERDPTTETFSLPQTQEEFYFGHPYDQHGPARARRRGGHRAGRPGAARRHGRRRRRERLRRGACACARRRRTCTRARASSTSTDRTTRPAADVCGIAGILHADPARPVDEPTLRRMARAIRHRGPDGYGIASGGGAGLVSTRLAIFDIPSGWQPMQGAHRDTVMVYNGEVFNHYELRQELEAQGERFRTTSDTEILLRLLDRDGPAALDTLQRAVGASPTSTGPTRTLTLMRDRFGVRPLHYALPARRRHRLLERGQGHPRLRPRRGAARPRGHRRGLHVLGRRARRARAFAGIRLLPPGHLLVWRDGEIVEERAWWEPHYAVDAPAPRAGGARRAAARLRAPAPARRRARRLLPLGRPRLEPHDGARGRADRPPAAHVLARVPRPALRRVGVPAPGRARSSAPSTT